MLNLINNNLYNASSFTNNIYSYPTLVDWTKSDVDKMPTNVSGSTISRSDFENMAKRMADLNAKDPSILGATSIKAELQNQGLWPSTFNVQSEYWSGKRLHSYLDGADVRLYTLFAISNTVERHNLTNKYARRHTYGFYGEAYDIENNKVVSSKQYYWHDSKYHVNKARWYVNIAFATVMTAKKA